MHIVQIANFFGPTSGGLRVALLELRARYLQSGHRVTTIVPGATDTEVRVGRDTIITRRSPTLPASGGYRVLVRRSPISALLGELCPDLIELSDKSTLHWVPAWARSRSVPCVLFSHERTDAVLAGRVPRVVSLVPLVDRWNARMVRNVDLIVGASCFAIEEYLRIDHPRIVRVPLGFEASVFRPDARGPAAPRWPEGPVQLVSVGRFSREKDPTLAVETMRSLHERGVAAHLAMIGDGPMRSRLERRAGQLDITFAGHLHDRHELARLVASADVVLAPGPAETFGLAALEALACGTPLVVPERGALAELVGTGCGIVTSSDGPSFASAVMSLLAGRRAEQRNAAVRHAARYSWDAAATRLLGEYRTLVVGDRPSLRVAPG